MQEGGDGGGFAARLADTHGTAIGIPTLHCFGSNDPLVYSSVALYNACDPASAQLHDHGLGHLVPRDADNVARLGDALSDVVARIDKEMAEVEAKARGGAETPPPFAAADDYASAGSGTSATSGSSVVSTAGSTAGSDLDSRSSHGAEPELELEDMAKLRLV